MKIISDATFAQIVAQDVWFQGYIEKLTAQNVALTEQIIELKRDGFSRPQPQLAAPYQHVTVDDRIMAAIRAMAPEGSRLEGELMQFANAALLAEGEVEDVADMILAGATLGDDD